MNESTNQRLSPDGRWLWDGYRWVPAPQRAPVGAPRVIGRHRNWLLVFAVLAVTLPLWGGALFWVVVMIAAAQRTG